MSRLAARVLKVGERVRLSPGGPVYQVKRVNSCAAYLRRRAEAKVVEFPDGRTFVAKEEGGILAVSPCSFVERVDEVRLPLVDGEVLLREAMAEVGLVDAELLRVGLDEEDDNA